MITLRKSSERGHANHGWLDTYFTFSFADYHDPAHMGFRSLRVINEDRVESDAGFPPHSHRDMEIVTYVLEGSLKHKDSMGNGSVIRPGEVQRMSAGTGVTHSEYNASPTEPLHLYQIWIETERPGRPPSYEQKEFPESERKNRLRVIVSPKAVEGSLTIHQDASIYAGTLDAGAQLSHSLAPGRHAWLQVARGSVRLGKHLLSAGDGAAVSGEKSLTIEAAGPSEVLLFDLP